MRSGVPITTLGLTSEKFGTKRSSSVSSRRRWRRSLKPRRKKLQLPQLHRVRQPVRMMMVTLKNLK